MSIHLDHTIVSAANRRTAAELLAEILDVPWAEARVGPFTAVHVNDGFTLDFDQAEGPFPVQHFCFRVGDAEFEAIVERLAAARVPYRSTPLGAVDHRINTQHGGKIVYWSEPDGHIWEALTASYARPSLEASRAPTTSR